MGTECPKACHAGGKGQDESETVSFLSQISGDDCNIAEQPQTVHDFVESVAEGEVGVVALGCLFASPCGASQRWHSGGVIARS